MPEEMNIEETNERIKKILAEAKKFAAEYYSLTGKPLGITGEVGEYEAACCLNLSFCTARTAGYDLTGTTIDGKLKRYQVKARAVEVNSKYKGRVSTIDIEKDFDAVLLVLLNKHYEVIEIREAGKEDVVARLVEPGSRSRNERWSMGISQFKSISDKVWPLRELNEVQINNPVGITRLDQLKEYLRNRETFTMTELMNHLNISKKNVGTLLHYLRVNRNGIDTKYDAQNHYYRIIH